MDLPVSSLIPWRVILAAETRSEINFSSLETYLPENRKMDRICKLMNLLQLEKEGVITLNQEKPFHDFKIKPKHQADTQILIKDRHGNEWNQDWANLCCEEKNIIIKKIKLRQVLCRQD
jgi:hypothetical protein